MIKWWGIIFPIGRLESYFNEARWQWGEFPNPEAQLQRQLVEVLKLIDRTAGRGHGKSDRCRNCLCVISHWS